MIANRRDRPAILGEVLFDCFPDGSSVLGGAPFNVAWHLQGFGMAPLLISRVGDDAAGQRVLGAMRDWGLDVTGVQLDASRPTGTVQVTLRDDQPEFAILPDQAYDYIDPRMVGAVAAGGDFFLLYHGTLITRSPASRRALTEIRRMMHVPAFVDVNLRPPWWDREGVRQALSGARWAKLNDSELAAVLGRDIDPGRLEQDAEALRRKYGLEQLIVTRGAEGALALRAGEAIHARPERVDDLVDTVGAGDAFSAVAILGLIKGWPLAATLRRAVAFAAALCRIRGATTRDPALYRAHLQQWLQ